MSFISALFVIPGLVLAGPRGSTWMAATSLDKPGHDSPTDGYFTEENEVGARNWLVIEATIGPASSVLARAESHSGSAPKAAILVSRSASDSHLRKLVRSWFDSPTSVVQKPA